MKEKSGGCGTGEVLLRETAVEEDLKKQIWGKGRGDKKHISKSQKLKRWWYAA